MCVCGANFVWWESEIMYGGSDICMVVNFEKSRFDAHFFLVRCDFFEWCILRLRTHLHSINHMLQPLVFIRKID